MKSESSKTTTMPHPTATMEHQKATGQTKKPLTAQQIFKYVNIVVVAVLMLCLRGFYDFRNHCIAKGYYVFASDSLIWCAIGFIGIFVH